MPLLVFLAVSGVYFGCEVVELPPYLRAGHEPVPFVAGTFENGELRFVDGLPVLILRGTPREMGRQAGHLCRQQIQIMVDEYIGFVYADADKKVAARSRVSTMRPYIPESYVEELRGMSATSNIPLDDLLLVNLFVDFHCDFVPQCTAVCFGKDASRDGKTIMGRNLDFPALGLLQNYNLLTVYHPENAQSFVSIGWPGMIGTATAINEKGLAVAILLSFDGESDFQSQSSLLTIRKIVQQATNLAEAEKILRDTPIAITYNFAIADQSGAIIVERGPKHFRVRHPDKDVLVCANNYGEDTGAPTIDQRYSKLCRLAKAIRGRADVALVRDAIKQVYIPMINLQAMVIIPQDRILHLSVGDIPAALGKYRTIDLRPLLRK